MRTMWMLGVMLMWGMPVMAVNFTVVKEAPMQGGFVVGKVSPRATVRLNNQKVDVAPDGYFVVGFERFAALKQNLRVCEGTKCVTRDVMLAKRDYKVQHVQGVPGKTVNPDKAQQARMAKDSKAIGASRTQFLNQAGFAGPFVLPVQADVSGVFGSRRTYNGEERSWHKGHDLAAPTGTLVRAPADGVVRMAQDTFMNGNLVVLDHGLYLTSLYAHLDSMSVHVGQIVKRGDILGAVGTTGRSTGPHLHWGMNWKTTPIDPALWVGHTYPQ